MSKSGFPTCLSVPGYKTHFLRHQLDVQKLGQKFIDAHDYPALICLFSHLPGVMPHQIGPVVQRMAEQYDHENFAALSLAMREHAPQLRDGVKTRTLQKFLARGLVACEPETYIKIIGIVVRAYGGAGLVRNHIRQAVEMVLEESDPARRNDYLFDLVAAIHGNKEQPTCNIAMQTLKRALQYRIIDIRYIPDCGTNPYLRHVGPVLLAVDRGGPLLALQKQKTGDVGEIVTQILHTDEIAALKDPGDTRKYSAMTRDLNAVKIMEFLSDARKFVNQTVFFSFAAKHSLRDARRNADIQIDVMLRPQAYRVPGSSRLTH